MGSVKATEFKDKVTRLECVELIRLLGHVRGRAIYALADCPDPKLAGRAQALTQVINQNIRDLADAIEQVKDFTHAE